MERYKLKEFAKWAAKYSISDYSLQQALEEMERGLVGDRLGAYLFKKRIGVAGRGKRGGVRTIVLFKRGELAVFLYGYAKNEKADLTDDEEEALRLFAKEFVRLSGPERVKRIRTGALVALEEVEQ